MENIIKYNMRMCLNKKTVIGFVIMMVVCALLPLGGGTLQKLQQVYGNIVPLFIMYIGALLFSSEFEWNTYKSTLTGKFSRIEMLLIKLLSVLIIAVLIAITQCIIFKAAAIYDGVNYDFSDTFHVVGCLVAFTLLISSVGFLTAILCRNFIGTYTVLFILFFDFFKECMVMAAEGIRNNSLKEFILNIPLSDALNGLRLNQYSGGVIVNMLVMSVICIAFAGIILDKRDL